MYVRPRTPFFVPVCPPQKRINMRKCDGLARHLEQGDVPTGRNPFILLSLHPNQCFSGSDEEWYASPHKVFEALDEEATTDLFPEVENARTGIYSEKPRKRGKSPLDESIYEGYKDRDGEGIAEPQKAGMHIYIESCTYIVRK